MHHYVFAAFIGRLNEFQCHKIKIKKGERKRKNLQGKVFWCPKSEVSGRGWEGLGFNEKVMRGSFDSPPLLLEKSDDPELANEIKDNQVARA